jgi:hypothetical protein
MALQFCSPQAISMTRSSHWAVVCRQTSCTIWQRLPRRSASLSCEALHRARYGSVCRQQAHVPPPYESGQSLGFPLGLWAGVPGLAAFAAVARSAGWLGHSLANPWPSRGHSREDTSRLPRPRGVEQAHCPPTCGSESARVVLPRPR